MHSQAGLENPPTEPGRVSVPRIDAIGAPNGAKYKMMSPAKLRISRSPCLTVPPGLSPSSLLESPVLLTNTKAEPSPTTGTFSLHSAIIGTVGSNSIRSPRGTYRNSAPDEGRIGDFEFKPHARSFSRSGLSSMEPLASGNPTQQEHASCRQTRCQLQTQKAESSQLVQAENTACSSHKLTVSVTASDPPIETLPLEANVPDEVASCELQQVKGSDNGLHTLQSHISGFSPTTGAEKTSEDGYNWRKYGQKLVKGCEFPRSYYKCTHPNCQMKKQLECSHDGQIMEIVYKGRHDHPKPETNRRLAVGTILTSQGEERSNRLSSLSSTEDRFLNAHMDPNGNTELSPISASDDDAEVGGSSHNVEEVADDDPESKRRKMDNATFDGTQIGKTNHEPRVVVQTISEIDILDDGYRWRKYGQKVVKGNPNPRSYYKCSNAGCSVRKHVERASHDPKAVITTYEGKHNHDVPAARNSSHDTVTTMITDSGNISQNGMLRVNYDTRPNENDLISPSLGVEQVHHREMQQLPGSDGNNLAILYGSSSNGSYGSRGSNPEGFSFKIPSVNHSAGHYYPNSGNLVIGP